MSMEGKRHAPSQWGDAHTFCIPCDPHEAVLLEEVCQDSSVLAVVEVTWGLHAEVG